MQSDLFICVYRKLIKVNQYGFSIITKANITSATGAIEKYSNCKFTEKKSVKKKNLKMSLKAISILFQ